MNSKKALFISVLFVLLLVSCSPSNNNSNGDTQQLADTALAATHAVETQLQLAVQQTIAAQAALITPTLTLTATSDRVMVSVSTSTYCRLGPVPEYPLIGILYVGQNAEAIGRNAYGDSVVIRLPDETSTNCWLWTAYATFTGNKDGLPIMTPPPLPATQTPTLLPAIPGKIKFKLENNSGLPIPIVKFRLSGTSDWGSDRTGSDTLNSGTGCWWLIDSGVYDVTVLVGSGAGSTYRNWLNVTMFSDTVIVVNP